jgi:hypothetical protein
MSAVSLMPARSMSKRPSENALAHPYRSTKLYVKISEAKNLPAKDLYFSTKRVFNATETASAIPTACSLWMMKS